MSDSRSKLLGQVFLLLVFSLLLYMSLTEKSLLKIVGGADSSEQFTTGFRYYFDSEDTLEETENAKKSSSPYWWLDSGGLLVMKDGLGYTNVGELERDSKWQKLYERSSPTDTDQGAHPQNLFRLITKGKWRDTHQEATFYIEKYNTSDSPNRNETNGLLLLSRYLDSDNLYYAGVRVDGYAVIKKKQDGKYYTLAEEKVFPGTYERSSKPNLIPTNEWLGLRSEVRNEPGNVKIILSMRQGFSGKWVKILEATDTGKEADLINKKGHAGVRTDFMDVRFENYLIERI